MGFHSTDEALILYLMLNRSLTRLFSPCYGTRRLFNTLYWQTVSPRYVKSSLRPFSNGVPLRMSPVSAPMYQASEDLKKLVWPEENLTSTKIEGGGFYPARLGEAFDNARFTITRKLGYGRFSTVWLARDRKFVSY